MKEETEFIPDVDLCVYNRVFDNAEAQETTFSLSTIFYHTVYVFVLDYVHCLFAVTILHRVEAVTPICLIRLGEAKLGLAKLGHPRLVFRVLRL